jgi:hypothetical protein
MKECTSSSEITLSNVSYRISDEPDSLDLSRNPRAVAFEYQVDLDALCVATSDGKIITHSLETSESECVGEIETGIQAMRWSPDYELVVFVTGEQKMLVMTREWEVLAEKLILKNEGRMKDRDE